ncbi:hypothetical protein SBA3_790021 [Candidatus Sulfopaludibacter sp. SbA3]|nr:hypothetical protein SBA3_790021 [Candidatus Sulfopaludibacter sp. SbA3]
MSPCLLSRLAPYDANLIATSPAQPKHKAGRDSPERRGLDMEAKLIDVTGRYSSCELLFTSQRPGARPSAEGARKRLPECRL